MIQFLVGTNVPFMKYRKLAYLFSGTLMLATVVWLVVHGRPRYSVDFTGGTLLQIRTSRSMHADQVRHALDAAGLHGTELQQMTGDNPNEFMIRVRQEGSENPADLFPRVQQSVQSQFPDVRV